ncbi:NB-ARC domain-containing protein [Paenibacillus wenxiniae]|uniref:NB-ARC domain-containing protein n=1 Tax=Paenibacillus wenxiniae TaxID=1636843 RepID=A0ABW4RLK9_9BACL
MNEHVEKEWPADMIKKLRTRPAAHQLQQKMRQVDLAKQVGVDPRTVQQWENGDRTPGSSSLKRLIGVFLQAGKFVVDAEMKEARLLWDTVKQMAEARSLTGREFASFDEAWFAGLLEAYQQTNTMTNAESLQRLAIMPNERAMDRVSQHSHRSTGNLPQQAALFIGRDAHMQTIRLMLEKGQVVSIVGSGGIGKTALAIHIAHQMKEQYPDGVWLLELATLQDADLLNHYALSVLGLQHQPERSELDIVLQYIEEKRILFILDNCEHLLDAGAALIETFIAANPQLRLIVTSRESLNIAAEQVYRLPPLTVPKTDDIASPIAEQIVTSESVQLFVARLQLVHPHHHPTVQEMHAIENICRRLEGIPLAIELAAARLTILSIEQIAERLTQLLTFLKGGRRTAAPRQQTLKATIDWSYSLLDRKEQQLLQRLSVFARNFTLDAVEAICVQREPEEQADHPIQQEEIIDLLSSLVNKSLVMREQQYEAGPVRYSMLETIREYAHHQLYDEASTASIQDVYIAHASYYDVLIRQLSFTFRTSERDQCLQQTRLEYSNLSIAMQRAYQGILSENSGMRIASSLYWFWLHEGMGNEGLLWLSRFLDHDSQLGAYDREALATAYHGQGVIQFVLVHLPEAYQSVEQSIILSHSEHYNVIHSASLRLLSFIRMHQQELDQAVVHAEESIQMARQHGDVWNLASSLHALGRMKLLLGEVESGTMLLKESIHYFKQADDRWELSGPYESLGYAALQAEQFQEAIDYFKKSISISQIYKGTWVLIRSLEGLIAALYATERYRETAMLIHAAQRYRQQEQMMGEQPDGIDMEQMDLEVNKQLTEHEQREIRLLSDHLSRERLVAYCLEL